MTKLKTKQKIDYIVATDMRNAIIDECARAVPTNWCDALLTGPDAPTGSFTNRDIEQLLRGIQDRIRRLKADQ